MSEYTLTGNYNGTYEMCSLVLEKDHRGIYRAVFMPNKILVRTKWAQHIRRHYRQPFHLCRERIVRVLPAETATVAKDKSWRHGMAMMGFWRGKDE